MKKILCIFSLIAFLSLTGGPAGAEELDWAKKAGSLKDAYGNSIAVDDTGKYIYVTGVFSGTIVMGAGEAKETNLRSAGLFDIFVAKYNRKGGLVWAKKAGGVNNDSSIKIAVDKWGNSYVTGVFNGTATFGGGEANKTVLTGNDFKNMFVAKI